MLAYGDLIIHQKLYSMSVIHRKLAFLTRFLLERFMVLSFLKETLLREIPILKFCRIGSEDFIFQQDRAPLHWHNQVRRFLNETLPQRCMGRTGAKDWALHSWPRSPDMTPCDFLMGLCKRTCLCSLLPAYLNELTNRIKAAIKSVTEDTLRHVRDEFSYRVDVRAAEGGHKRHL